MEAQIITATMADALAQFDVTKGAILELCGKAKATKVAGPADELGMAAARKMRLQLKSIRVEGEKRRKSLNEDAVRYQKTVNAAAHELFDPVEEAEAHLQREEDTAERERQRILAETQAKLDAARKAKLDGRLAAMAAVESVPMSMAWLETASDADFDGAVALARNQMEAKRAAEQERAERELVERERQRVESERIAQERAEFERQRAEAQARDEAAAQMRREEDARLAAERELVERERRKIEDAKAAEARAKELEDAKAKAAAEAIEQLARERASAAAKAARREANKPVLQRIRELALAIQSHDIPKTDAADEIQAILTYAGAQILAVAERMEQA